MMTMRYYFVFLLATLATLDCHPQDKYKIQIWMKDGNMYQYPVENVDSINFTSRKDIRDWQELMRFPSLNEIERYNDTCTARSPYTGAWFTIDKEETFTEFSIDFKADYIPSATYCSPVNFYIDYSSLLEKYDSVNNGGHISGYGGFQRHSESTCNSRLSLWDVYCKKKSGETDTIQATLVSPEGEVAKHYSHEGNFVSYIDDYSWMPRRWYRMLLQMGTSEATGNTTLMQWIGDLSEKKWKRACIFDLGAPGLKFKGQTAAFLENFGPKYAGDIRTMEFKNVRIYSHIKHRWINIYSAYLYNDLSQTIKKSGSYQFGADEDTFWMITTGIPDCAQPQNPATFEVSESETATPLNL